MCGEVALPFDLSAALSPREDQAMRAGASDGQSLDRGGSE